MEALEQPGGRIPALNFMAISDQRHANVSKKMLLADDNVVPPHDAA